MMAVGGTLLQTNDYAVIYLGQSVQPPTSAFPLLIQGREGGASSCGNLDSS